MKRPVKPHECGAIWGGHICYRLKDHDGTHECGEPSNQRPCRAEWGSEPAEQQQTDVIVGTVHRLDDHRKFDAGTPLRCYGCGAREGVRQLFGEGGYVWACPDCPHPAD